MGNAETKRPASKKIKDFNAVDFFWFLKPSLMCEDFEGFQGWGRGRWDNNICSKLSFLFPAWEGACLFPKRPPLPPAPLPRGKVRHQKLQILMRFLSIIRELTDRNRKNRCLLRHKKVEEMPKKYLFVQFFEIQR